MTLPPATQPRINPEDHGAKLVLVIAITLAYTIFTVGTRLQARWPWNSLLRREDYFLLVATSFSIVYTGIIAVAIQHGLGQHTTAITEANTILARRMVLGSNVVAWIAEGISFISYALFILTLSVDSAYCKRIQWCLYVNIAWILTAIIVGLVAVGLNSPVAVAASATLTGIQAALYIVVYALAMRLIWATTMATRSKTTVLMWFSFTLCAAGFIVARPIIHSAMDFQGDWLFNSIDPLIYRTVQMHVCIVNAAYITLLKFLDNSSSGFSAIILTQNTSSRVAKSTVKSTPKSTQTSTHHSEMLRLDLQKGDHVFPQDVDCTRSDSQAGRMETESCDSQVILVRTSVTVKREPKI